jgi:hypothetical protein
VAEGDWQDQMRPFRIVVLCSGHPACCCRTGGPPGCGASPELAQAGIGIAVPVKVGPPDVPSGSETLYSATLLFPAVVRK